MSYIYPLTDAAAAFVCVMNKQNKNLTVKCLSNFRILHTEFDQNTQIKICFLDLNMDMEFIEMNVNLNEVLDYGKYNCCEDFHKVVLNAQQIEYLELPKSKTKYEKTEILNASQEIENVDDDDDEEDDDADDDDFDDYSEIEILSDDSDTYLEYVEGQYRKFNMYSISGKRDIYNKCNPYQSESECEYEYDDMS